MDQSGNFIPITRADRARWKPQADAYMAKVEWADKEAVARVTGKFQPTALIPTTPRVPSQMSAISLIDVGHDESQDQLLLSESVLHVLQTIRRGLTIGLHLEELYTKASGLDVLLEQSRTGRLVSTQQPELTAKSRTRAAVTVFVLASYVVSELSSYKQDEVSNVVMQVDPPEKLQFGTTQEAIRSTLFYFGKEVQVEGKVESDEQFVKFALLFFRHVIAAVKMREEGLQYTEPFTERKYKLEEANFTIEGFREPADNGVVSVEFKRLEFSEIVGNRLAKHAAKRAIDRLCCYDPERKMNPILEIGGLGAIRLGEGQPGTGKSMLIAATATLLSDRCKAIGIPFLFHPLPDGLISTYQGGSAERMDAWMRALRDPTKIVFAPIDDAEGVFKNRSRGDVSEGERGVQGVFLRQTEGAYAIPRGNTLIDFCTNLPELIDPATMSRIVDRYRIDGARTENDVLDQDELAFRRFRSYSPDFDDTKDPTDYAFFADQQGFGAKGERRERYEKPRTEKVALIYEEVLKHHSPQEKRFFAKFVIALQREFPVFTSRDIRNIQSAVASRILDFDMPDEWFEDPKRFAHLPYDEKKGMLIELTKTNMKGLSFAEIRREELFRYADGVAQMADVAFEREVEAMVRQIRVQEAAQRRLRQG